MKNNIHKYEKSKKLNKRFLHDSRGSAIVIVIIAMAMIGILVSSILWSAYMNYMIKMNDIKNKESFYSAETVMEQIVAGLQHEASAAITLSYQEVMQNWNPNGTQDMVVEGEKDRSSRFAISYLSILIRSLMDTSDSVPSEANVPLTSKKYYYDRDKLRAFIDDSLFARMDNQEEWNGIDTETKKDNIMEIVDDSILILRNIRVVFTDDKGYVSIINTDICIDVPELVFYQNPGNEGGRQRKCSEPRQRGASISAGESHDYDAHLLYVWGESGRICLRCSAARLCAAQSKRRFAGSGTGYILRWRCHDSWQPAGRSAAQTQGQGARHLFDDAVFIRHRKFPAGPGPGTSRVVSGGGAGVGVHPGDERQPGRPPAPEYPPGDAGTGLLRPERPAVFYHPGGLPAGRVAGGPRL